MTAVPEQKPWRIAIGIHQGTMMSRDFHSVSTKFDDSSAPLQSLADCIECAQAWRENYRKLGYFIWYAHAIAPDGTKHPGIIPGTPYR